MPRPATALVIVPWADVARAQEFADSVCAHSPEMSRPVVTAGEGGSWINTSTGDVGERITLHGWRVVTDSNGRVTLERVRTR